MRKRNHDNVYKALQYVPYSSTMPADPDVVKWMWEKKGTKHV